MAKREKLQRERVSVPVDLPARLLEPIPISQAGEKVVALAMPTADTMANLQIGSDEDAERVGVWYRACREREREILAWFEDPEEGIEGPLKALIERISAKKKAALGPLRAFIGNAKKALGDWEAERRRRVREDEERRARQVEEEARARRAQELKTLEDAAKATASRKEKTMIRQQAEAIRTAPLPVALFPLEDAPKPAPAGLGFQTTYRGQVVDFERLVVACAIEPLLRILADDSELPDEAYQAIRVALARRPRAGLELLEVNQVALNRLAVAIGDGPNPIPGMQIVVNTTPVERRAR